VFAWVVAGIGAYQFQVWRASSANTQVYTDAEVAAFNTKRKAETAAAAGGGSGGGGSGSGAPAAAASATGDDGKMK
jgi:hypothetical protein